MDAAERLMERLRAQMDARGTLDVLRNGVEMHPVRGKIALAQFKPGVGV
jgi:type I restriction enzyme R subunit